MIFTKILDRFFNRIKEQMDEKTHEALENSIAAWEEKALTPNPNNIGMGPSQCPLCVLFFYSHDCVGCPVAGENLERCGCHHTPYEDAENALDDWINAYNHGSSLEEFWRNKFRAAAQREIDFLKSLQS